MDIISHEARIRQRSRDAQLGLGAGKSRLVGCKSRDVAEETYDDQVVGEPRAVSVVSATYQDRERVWRPGRLERRGRQRW